MPWGMPLMPINLEIWLRRFLDGEQVFLAGLSGKGGF